MTVYQVTFSSSAPGDKLSITTHARPIGRKKEEEEALQHPELL
jgi:hypothetical protein